MEHSQAPSGNGNSGSSTEGKPKKNRLFCILIALVLALFVGLAVIGLVAAVALPLYSTFKAKTQFAQTIQPLWALKTQLVDEYREQGAFPSQFESLEEIENRYQVSFSPENLDYHYEAQDQGMTMTAEFTDGTLRGEYIQLKIECENGDCKGAIITSKPEFGLDNQE